MIGALLPAAHKCRGLAGALAARAMLRIGDGAIADAWQDLLACHRLGRLVGRGGTLIEGLVGMAINSVACNADRLFLSSPSLDAKQIEQCLRDLQQLAPLPGVAEKVSLTERFMFLDTVVMLDCHGMGYLEGLSGGKPGQPDPLAERILDGIDWDPTLKSANQWYDRLAAALREKDRAAREKKLDQIDMELKKVKAEYTNGFGLAPFALGDGAARGKALGDVLIGLLAPAVRKVSTAADRTRQVEDNVELAFALAWYHREQGHYPKELDALTPRYLKQIPPDVFSGKALQYRPHDNSYLLYSVGINGKDDDGHGPEDVPPGDDLSVRMPLPELQRK